MISEEDYPVWNGYLYQLQQDAPRPKAVLCINPEAAIGRPPYFGDECHGLIPREEADILCKEEGNFLIRESQSERGRYTLVLRILGKVKNFKLFWKDGEHFVGDKRFDDIYALVEDGLITMYVEEKAHDYIQNMSKSKEVYCSLSRTKQLLSRHMPDHQQVRMTTTDARMSPHRDPVRMEEGGQGSPRHAHNGRNTEDAALPYSHNYNPADSRQQFHNPAYIQSPIAEEDINTVALEDKLMTTDMLTENPGYQRGTPNNAYYNHPMQQERSMIQSLMNGQQNLMNNYQPRPGPPPTSLNPPGSGGTKKTLTPTSSDERKRTKAKKFATEETISQQQLGVCNERGNDLAAPGSRNNSTMHGRNQSPVGVCDSRRSPATNGANYPRTQVPPNFQQQRGPFHQHPNNYISQPAGNVLQHSPMRRNNSDFNQAPASPYHCSMPAQHMQTNVAHVRQLSGGSSSGGSIASSNSASGNMQSGPKTPGMAPKCKDHRTQGFEGKVVLDANDNQMVLSPGNQRRAQHYDSPTRSRQSPRQQGFDSSGSEVIPAKTFHQLKIFQRRLEEASDEDIRKEAKDKLATLSGQKKTPVRLTRSNTTACTAGPPRPSSGKAPPRLAPRDAHYRQRSEPVELFQNHSVKMSHPDDSQGPLLENALYKQQQQNNALREDLRNRITRRNREQAAPADQMLPSDLRAGSGSSCDSSLSNVSVGSAVHHHQQDPYYKHPDAISHVSSEDWMGEDRESSPSPHSTGQRSCSSDDNSGSALASRGSRNQSVRQSAVSSSSDVLLQKKQAEERAAHVKASPFSHSYNGVIPNHGESDDVMTALPNATQASREKPDYRRTKSEATLSGYANNNLRSTHVPPEVNNAARPRRKSSDREPSSSSRSHTNNKARHHSETSSEEGTPRPVVPITPVHKPLQRRATTGSDVNNKKDLERQLPRANGFASPVKNTKKSAQRSNSGPSPRKSKKSPEGAMSPRMHHAHHQRSMSSPRNEMVPHYEKEHVFKSHTYRGLQWCEYCGNFMWGIIQQGMQCRDCGLNVHKQCSKLVPGDCQPALKHVKNVFGIDLTALVKLHGTERPIVVDKCIEEIEQRGMESEGIYRVSGMHDDIQELKLVFDRYGSDVNLAVYEDINIVAGGLKLYLRELPVPLIPYNLYSRFINAAKLSHSDGKLEAIRTALDMMPPAHLQTLKHIIQHLGRVCECNGNQMNSQNLGIVFGPTMLRPPEKASGQARYNLNDAQYQKEIVEAIIDYRTQLFRQQDTAIRETHNL